MMHKPVKPVIIGLLQQHGYSYAYGQIPDGVRLRVNVYLEEVSLPAKSHQSAGNSKNERGQQRPPNFFTELPGRVRLLGDLAQLPAFGQPHVKHKIKGACDEQVPENDNPAADQGCEQENSGLGEIDGIWHCWKGSGCSFNQTRQGTHWFTGARNKTDETIRTFYKP
jgi:hypothetical protein